MGTLGGNLLCGVARSSLMTSSLLNGLDVLGVILKQTNHVIFSSIGLSSFLLKKANDDFQTLLRELSCIVAGYRWVAVSFPENRVLSYSLFSTANVPKRPL